MTTALGIELPQLWSASRLKHVTKSVRRGSAPDYVDDGPVRAIGQGAVQHAGFDWERTRFHEHVGDPSLLRGFLHPGDVLINSTGTGTLGRVGFFETAPDEIPCMADGHITVARFRAEELNPRFAYYWLTSQAFQTYTSAALTVGSTNQIELSRDRLRDADVPVPPVREQAQIAAYLDAEIGRISQLVFNRTKMQIALELKRRAITLDILGLAGRTSHDSLVPLKYLVDQISVGIVVTPAKWYVSTAGVPALRGLNVKPGQIATSDLVQISHEGHALHQKSALKEGDVVVVRTGQAGNAAVVPQELEGANCIDLIRIRPGVNVLPKYLECLLNSEYARSQVTENSVGSIQGHFNVGAMKQMSIPRIRPEAQKSIVSEIAHQVGRIDALAAKLSEQISVVGERRQALITAAVTGQFDVSAASGRGVTE